MGPGPGFAVSFPQSNSSRTPRTPPQDNFLGSVLGSAMLFAENSPSHAPSAPQDIKIAPANPGETQRAGGLLGAPAEVLANRVSPYVLFLGPLNHLSHKLFVGVRCGWEHALPRPSFFRRMSICPPPPRHQLFWFGGALGGSNGWGCSKVRWPIGWHGRLSGLTYVSASAWRP